MTETDLATQHSALRCAEGWEIFEASGSSFNRNGDAPYQLMRLDEEALLEDDVAAHKLVVERAKQGAAHAISALQKLREESKPELVMIYYSTLKEPGSYTWESVIDGDRSNAYLDQLETELFGHILTRSATADACILSERTYGNPEDGTSIHVRLYADKTVRAEVYCNLDSAAVIDGGLTLAEVREKLKELPADEASADGTFPTSYALAPKMVGSEVSYVLVGEDVSPNAWAAKHRARKGCFNLPFLRIDEMTPTRETTSS